MIDVVTAECTGEVGGSPTRDISFDTRPSRESSASPSVPKPLAALSEGGSATSERSSCAASTRSSGVRASPEAKRKPSKTSRKGSKGSASFSNNAQTLVHAESLGIAFSTRAAAVPGPKETSLRRDSNASHYRKHCRALSKVFPVASAADDGCKSGTARGTSVATCFAGTSAFARRTARGLRISGMLSCIYVLWVVAVESACVLEEHLSRPSSLESWLTIAHLANALLYALVAIPSRLLFSRIDLCRAEELTRPSDIILSHLKSPGLYLDLLALGGFVAELVHIGRGPRPGIPSGAQWAMLLQFGKGWRIILPEEPPSSERNSFLQGVARLFLSLAFFAHVMASLLLILGNYEKYWGDESWIDVIADSDTSCPVLYTEAIYYAVLSLTSVGYGDVLVTTLERAVNAFFLILAQLFTAKVCADLTWLTSTHNHWEAQHEARRTQTWVALQRMEVPKVLRKRVLAFQNYTATVHREDLAQPALAGLSSNLIQELRLCAYQKLVLKAPFLREQPKEVISLIVSHLHDAVFLPADFVVRAGESGRELFFMRRGECAVYVGPNPPCWGESLEVAKYTSGDYFGELGMLTGRPRAAWIMAKAYCVCSVLPYSAVELLSAEYPCAFTTLVRCMVNAFQMKSSMDWAAVSQRLSDKYAFACAEDAFHWFCEQGGADDEELTAKAFETAMLRLKVPELDRKILWAEMDLDNSGFVCIDEFMAKVVLQQRSVLSQTFNVRRRSPLRCMTRLSTNTSDPSLENFPNHELFAECQRRMGQMGMVLSATTPASGTSLSEASPATGCRTFEATIPNRLSLS